MKSGKFEIALIPRPFPEFDGTERKIDELEWLKHRDSSGKILKYSIPIQIHNIFGFKHTRDAITELNDGDIVLGVMVQESTLYLLSSMDRIVIRLRLDYWNSQNDRVWKK